MRRWLPALALCALAYPGLARAQVSQDSFQMRNAADLADLCSAPNSDPLYTAAQNFCHGFVVGVYRVLNEEDAGRSGGRFFCMPASAPSRTQQIANFVQWVRTSPGQMQSSAQDAVAAYLVNQYPCSRGSSPRRAG